MKKKVETLQVILKNSERCNIACTYCYYFFSGDESYKNRPPLISKEVVMSTVDFLKKAQEEMDIETMHIVFHGGEPMMQKKQNFKWTCEMFRKNLSLSKTKLILGIQTNGMLVNNEWLKIFDEYNVNVSVSLDGDEYFNDLNRVDKKGHGTYQRVVNGLKLAQGRAIANKQPPTGLLTVINHEFKYNRIFKHFVDDLKIENIGILLPDLCYDDGFPEGVTAEDYGDILIELFDLWLERQRVHLKPISKVLDFFQEKKLSQTGKNKLKKRMSYLTAGGDVIENQIIVIQSDGELSLDDSFMVAKEWRLSAPYMNVSTTSLDEYLNTPIFKEIQGFYDNLPKECEECTWKKICKGGDLENRYKTGNGFNQPSIFCNGLKKYYQHVVEYLYKTGYPKEKLIEKLGLN